MVIAETRAWRATSATAAEATVFLSHSHQDTDLVEATVRFFASRRVHLYVDWLDPKMPEVTDPNTALELKKRIRSLRRFVVLVTDRSSASRWVPWELGYADGVKREHDIAVFPVPNATTQPIAEYIGIYSRIEMVGNNAVVIPPQRGAPVMLDSWLRAP